MICNTSINCPQLHEFYKHNRNKQTNFTNTATTGNKNRKASSVWYRSYVVQRVLTNKKSSFWKFIAYNGLKLTNMRQVNHNISIKLTVPSILPTCVSWDLTPYKIVKFCRSLLPESSTSQVKCTAWRCTQHTSSNNGNHLSITML